MKNTSRSLLLVVIAMMWLLFFMPQSLKSCDFNDSYPYTSITPTAAFQVVNLVYSGERYQFTGVQDMVYVFSYCQGGGSNVVDTQLEIFDLGGTSYEYNDDHCGLGSEITWVCPANGTYVIVTYEYNCNANGTNAGNMAYKVMPAPTDQDCLGAIPLCFENYYTAVSYSGSGNYPSEIPTTGGCPGNCLMSGELNSVWYTFTTQTAGNVSFVIDPNNSSDDYDWAVYNITNHDCATIGTNPSSVQVSCNYTATPGATGPNGGGSTNCIGASGSAFNQTIPVSAGQTFVVNVSNWSSTNYGYEIDFGGSTSQILDESEPFLESIVFAPVCGQNSITVQFSENVLCSSITASDFIVSGPNGNYEVGSVSSPSCVAGSSYDDIYTLTMSDVLVDGGTYTVELTGANNITDICYNQAVNMGLLSFSFVGLNSSATVVQGVTCNGYSDGQALVNASGGVSPYYYNWTSGETTSSASNLQGGTNYVTVSDFYGCQDVVPVDIPEPPPVLPDLGPDIFICGGESAQLGANLNIQNGVSPFTYHWTPEAGLSDPNAENPVASPTAATTYTVEVTDANGCIGSDSFTVDIYPAIDISLITTDPLCYNQASGSIEAVVSGGTPDYSYLWSNTQNTAIVNNLFAGDYSVTVTDFNNCTAEAEASLNYPPELVATATTEPTECGELIGSASINASGGTGTYTYLWSTTETTQQINGLHPGDFYCTVTDSNGCTIEVLAEVGFYGEGEVQITQLQEVLCYGDATGVLQAQSLDGTGPFSYFWSNNSSNNTINNLLAGDYSITLTDVYGCEAYADYTITQPPQIIVNSEISDVLCRGGSDGHITLLTEGGVSPYVYSWSNGSTSSHVSGLSAGTYSVTITDMNGCIYQDYYIVTQPEKDISMQLITQDVQCFNQNNGAAMATAEGGTPPITVIWYQYGSVIASGEEVNSLPAGNYAVKVVDENDCWLEDYFTINQPEKLEVEYSVTGASCQGNDDGIATLTVYGGTYPYDYEWITGDVTESIENVTSGYYMVTVTDANNCEEYINVYLPESSSLCLKIPNAFTPNADGVNDTWIIEYLEKYPSAEVYVFNRWGQAVYNGRPGVEPWDGTFEGNRVPSGSYTYVVDLRNGMLPFTGVLVVVY
jgi:gliding motility-associated-like protein